jgi:tRNA threonylcarbamoyladenosine biosynthesis protein TsaE
VACNHGGRGSILKRLTNKVITTQSEDETVDAARALGAALSAGHAVLLFGDLGAGKTAFVRGLAEGLGIASDQVSSPTFTLVQEYRGGRLPLIHVDLYRLNDPREIDDLGLEEIGGGAVLAIEWAEKLRPPPDAAIEVHISHGNADTRTLAIQFPGNNNLTAEDAEEQS